MLENKKSIIEEIESLKKNLTGKVLIAAHHYQKKELIQIADVIGDSYRLAVIASKSEAKTIILCGVRFMAESAALLARPDQKILLPDFSAACPMADMISPAAAEKALDRIAEITGEEALPLSYVNSWANLKALTGLRKGSTCTSGNAKKIMEYYLSKGKRILFMPDKNLGINTARSLGLVDSDFCFVSKEGFVPDSGANARVFLWDGYCPVHLDLKAEHVKELRAKFPSARLMVHPECSEDLVSLSDFTGSTEGMAKAIQEAPADSQIAVGTEYRFIERMKKEYSEKEILPLKQVYCKDMDLINLENVLSVLRAYEDGKSDTYRVSIEEKTAINARKALSTMIAITEGL